MAAPTLETNAGATILRITAGTSGNPVTWDDVWDWDDGGGSSGGDGDVPKDGGGTAKVNTFMTEVVADAVYTIEDDIWFGNAGGDSTYFQSKNEMVYFANDKIFTQKANSHLILGDLVGGWGVNGSMWSVNLSGTHAVTAYGIAGDFNMYASHIHLRQAGNTQLYWNGLDVDIRNSIFSGIANDAGVVGFNVGGVSLQLRDVIFHNLYELNIRISPSVASDIRWHNLTYGNNSGSADVTITDLLATSISSYEIRLWDNQTIIVKDPRFHFTTLFIANASGVIIEQYTCNIHTTDKDGMDLDAVDVDCEFAHLVEGTDAKTYKCIVDHTSVADGNDGQPPANDGNNNWELWRDAGGLGDWVAAFDYKEGTQEFATDITDAAGDITEQVIQYKKWLGVSEIEEARIHKFTFTHADYPDLVMSDIIADHPIVWEIDMGQATADLTTIVQAVIETNNLDHLLKVAVSNRDTMPEIVNDTVLANIITKTDGTTADFDHATDSLEAIRDKQNNMHGGLHH